MTERITDPSPESHVSGVYTAIPPPDREIPDFLDIALEPSGLTEQSEAGDREALWRRLGVQLVDMSSGVTAEAADSADEYLRQQTTGHGLRGFLKKIWYGNLARDYLRQREMSRAKKEIAETGNLYAASGGSQVEHDRAAKAVVDRFTNQFEFVHKRSGEFNRKLTEYSSGEEFTSQLSLLIDSFVHGKIEPEALTEEKTRLVGHFVEQYKGNDRRVGLLFADNIIEVAKNAKAAFEHGIALETIKNSLDFKVGEARMGVRTQASREVVDRAIDKLYNTKIGSLVNETTLATAAAVALAISKFTVRKLVTAIVATVGMGVGAGIIAGLRESHHTKQERRLHIRQMAEGGEINQGNNKRRARMEETRYQTISCDQLLDKLHATIEDNQEDGSAPIRLLDLIDTVTETTTRIAMSDELSCDFITYSNKKTVEQQRLELDIALARAKVALQRLTTTSDDKVLQSVGLEGGNLNELILTRTELLRGAIKNDMSDRDRAFRKLRLERSVTAAAIGATVGIILGVGSQEIRAAIDPSLQGVFAPIRPVQNRSTELAAIFRHSHESVQAPHMPNAIFEHSTFKLGNNALDLPAGYHVAHIAGHDELIGPGNAELGVISLGTNGYLTPSSQHVLEHQGFRLDTTTETFQTTHLETVTTTVTPTDYIATHSSEFTPVQRQLWYANNSSIPDRNELRLYWGGSHGSGIDGNGDYVFSVSHMTTGGSFEGNHSVNVPKLVDHHQLFMAISLDKASQNNVVLVPIDANGNATFNPNDPVFHSVFDKINGHAHFTGGYAEVVQLTGKNAHGATTMRMMATVVGSNRPITLTSTVSTIIHQTSEHVVTHLEPPLQPTSTMLPIEVAPVLPLRARQGLGDLRGTEITSPAFSSGYYMGESSREVQRRWAQDRSPRLRRNPNATLNTAEELSWYRRQLKSRRGAEYLNEIDDIIDQSPELNSIDNAVDAILCITVAAANEPDNIYRTLSLYDQQSAASKRATRILLNVNWKEKLESDPTRRAAIDKTISEIERAKVDFPSLKIAIFNRRWKDEDIRLRDGVLYGEIVKQLYDVALVSMERAVREGRRDNKDALLINNDADALGLRHNYLDIYLRALNRYPESDAFSGLIRFGTESHKKYPGFGISTNIMSLLSLASGRKSAKHVASPATSGANSGFRMSSLAAIGGSDDTLGLGAGSDVILGRRIRAARAGGEAIQGRPSAKASSRKASARRRSTRTIHLATRQAVRYLVGAQIDTNADRFLGVYRRGRLIGSSWRDFDEDGYRDRREELKGLAKDDREDPVHDIDTIAHRIEKEIEYLGSDWYPDHNLLSWTLGTYFGKHDKRGKPIYKLNWRKDNRKLEFAFTDEGKRWLRNRLTRDTRGNSTPYGAQVRRRLYGEKGKSKQPLHQTRRMVKGT
jgi:hypothetical protein